MPNTTSPQPRAGDVICQYITKGDSANWVLDLKRMFVFATWGAIGFTPLAFKWYGGMETAVPANIPYRFLVKTVLDQTVFSTGVTMLTFSMAALSSTLFIFIFPSHTLILSFSFP